MGKEREREKTANAVVVERPKTKTSLPMKTKSIQITKKIFYSNSKNSTSTVRINNIMESKIVQRNSSEQLTTTHRVPVNKICPLNFQNLPASLRLSESPFKKTQISSPVTLKQGVKAVQEVRVASSPSTSCAPRPSSPLITTSNQCPENQNKSQSQEVRVPSSPSTSVSSTCDLRPSPPPSSSSITTNQCPENQNKSQNNNSSHLPNSSSLSSSSTTSSRPLPSNSLSICVPDNMTAGCFKKLQRQEKRRLLNEKAQETKKKQKLIEKEIGPLHDPKDKDWFNESHRPLILYPPKNTELPHGKVPVVVDPRLSEHLQRHQRYGIWKIYKYLTDPASSQNGHCGFILADGMGLGKTLQCISILWTFLTQSPEWSETEKKVKPLIKKAIIVCPAAVITTVWQTQIDKWILSRSKGKSAISTRMEICALDDKVTAKQKKILVNEFMSPEDPKQCLIISYECFVEMRQNYQVNDDINDEILPGPLAYNEDNVVGLFILDEAHYFKNFKSKRHQEIAGFPVRMKIALTGTPIQNNLKEYYSLLSILQPEFKIKFPKFTFKTDYINPITRYIETREQTKEWAMARQKLRSFYLPFYLRRISNPFVNSDKTEYIICCKMETSHLNNSQFELYNKFIDCYKAQFNMPQPTSEDENEIEEEENSSDVDSRKSKRRRRSKPKLDVNAFQAISYLKFLCSHPALVEKTVRSWKEKQTPGFQELIKIYENDEISSSEPDISTKMTCLMSLLKEIGGEESTFKDRVVIVSYYTTILDQIEELCNGEKFPCVRYDGKIAGKKRNRTLRAFNDHSSRNQFILLLSCKAGGCGISLTGANHLIMFDPDWNPANDDQAMARIYREGQLKDCHIYRLLTTGSIEEAQFKRQIFKKMLVGQVLSDGDVRGIYDCSDNQLSSSSFASSSKKNEKKETSSETNGSNGDFSYLQEALRVDTVSLTHEDLDCDKAECRGHKRNEKRSRSSQDIEDDDLDLKSWQHIYNGDQLPQHSALRLAWLSCEENISMVFRRTIKSSKVRQMSLPADGNNSQQQDDEDWYE